jgi:hypothetical protein
MIPDPKWTDETNFYFKIDRSPQAYPKQNFKPPVQIDFQMNVRAMFMMGRDQDNNYELDLFNVQTNDTSTPYIDHFIYTLYWGDSEDDAIYKKSWYLTGYDSCKLYRETDGIQYLNYKMANPKAILTGYF